MEKLFVVKSNNRPENFILADECMKAVEDYKARYRDAENVEVEWVYHFYKA